MIEKKIICYALNVLVPFVLFKKREKNPLKNVSFSKVACYFTKNNTYSRVQIVLNRAMHFSYETLKTKEIVKSLTPSTLS